MRDRGGNEAALPEGRKTYFPQAELAEGNRRLIRSKFLNYYGTLFGGYMMQWADDMAYNVTSLASPGARFVTKLFGQFDFTTPVGSGDIIKIFSEVEHVGATSRKIKVWAVNAQTGADVFRTFAVMVNVREGNAVPVK